MSTSYPFKPIVRDGLVFYLDAANDKSYTGTGTNWNDLTSSGSNGSLTNGPTFDSNNGGSIVFDGVNDYVNVPSNTYIAITGDMTMCAWVYVNSLSGYNSIVGKTTGGGLPNPYDIYTNPSSGTVVFLRGNGSVYANTVSNTGLTINTWQHVAVTMTSTTAKHYLNGQPDGSGTISTSIGDGGGDLRVGSRDDLVTKMNGRISSVMMYKRGLTDSEILKNYYATKKRYGLW